MNYAIFFHDISLCTLLAAAHSPFIRSGNHGDFSYFSIVKVVYVVIIPFLALSIFNKTFWNCRLCCALRVLRWNLQQIGFGYFLFQFSSSHFLLVSHNSFLVVWCFSFLLFLIGLCSSLDAEGNQVDVIRFWIKWHWSFDIYIIYLNLKWVKTGIKSIIFSMNWIQNNLTASLWWMTYIGQFVNVIIQAVVQWIVWCYCPPKKTFTSHHILCQCCAHCRMLL